MKRGEIYYADLGQTEGSEQGGTRPVVIIQNDRGNKCANTVIVACITTKKKKSYLPVHVQMSGTCLRPDNMILCEQIKTIDKSRLRGKAGKLTDEQIYAMNEALRISMEL